MDLLRSTENVANSRVLVACKYCVYRNARQKLGKLDVQAEIRKVMVESCRSSERKSSVYIGARSVPGNSSRSVATIRKEI